MSIGMHKCAGCTDAQDAEIEEDEHHDGFHCEPKVNTVGPPSAIFAFARSFVVAGAFRIF